LRELIRKARCGRQLVVSQCRARLPEAVVFTVSDLRPGLLNHPEFSAAGEIGNCVCWPPDREPGLGGWRRGEWIGATESR
jgi:hypothetical protein